MVSSPARPLTPSPTLPHCPPFIVECAACGFEPDDQVRLPARRCPKCRGFAWRRLIHPGSLLAAVNGHSKHSHDPLCRMIARASTSN